MCIKIKYIIVVSSVLQLLCLLLIAFALKRNNVAFTAGSECDVIPPVATWWRQSGSGPVYGRFSPFLWKRFQKLHRGPDSRSGRRVRVDYGVSREALTTRSLSFPTTPWQGKLATRIPEAASKLGTESWLAVWVWSRGGGPEKWKSGRLKFSVNTRK